MQSQHTEGAVGEGWRWKKMGVGGVVLWWMTECVVNSACD